jgi:hypothetical protein
VPYGRFYRVLTLLLGTAASAFLNRQARRVCSNAGRPADNDVEPIMFTTLEANAYAVGIILQCGNGIAKQIRDRLISRLLIQQRGQGSTGQFDVTAGIPAQGFRDDDGDQCPAGIDKVDPKPTEADHDQPR